MKTLVSKNILIVINYLLTFCLITFILDACFSVIYNQFKRTPVETLDAYKSKIEKAFNNQGMPLGCQVQDVYAIPDYQEWLQRDSSVLDSSLKNLYQ